MFDVNTLEPNRVVTYHSADNTVRISLWWLSQQKVVVFYTLPF